MRKLIILLALIPSFASASLQMSSKDARELDCLAKNLYFEARGENIKGMAAVAQVTRNRVEAAKFPTTYCKVVYQSKQFSWTNSKKKRSISEEARWFEAKLIASVVYFVGDWPVDLVGDSLYYHTLKVKPYWAKKMKYTVTIGNHKFYKPIVKKSKTELQKS